MASETATFVYFICVPSVTPTVWALSVRCTVSSASKTSSSRMSTLTDLEAVSPSAQLTFTIVSV